MRATVRHAPSTDTLSPTRTPSATRAQFHPQPPARAADRQPEDFAGPLDDSGEHASSAISNRRISNFQLGGGSARIWKLDWNSSLPIRRVGVDEDFLELRHHRRKALRIRRIVTDVHDRVESFSMLSAVLTLPSWNRMLTESPPWAGSRIGRTTDVQRERAHDLALRVPPERLDVERARPDALLAIEVRAVRVAAGLARPACRSARRPPAPSCPIQRAEQHARGRPGSSASPARRGCPARRAASFQTWFVGKISHRGDAAVVMLAVSLNRHADLPEIALALRDARLVPRRRQRRQQQRRQQADDADHHEQSRSA